MEKINPLVFTGSEYEPYFAFWKKFAGACPDGFSLPPGPGFRPDTPGQPVLYRLDEPAAAAIARLVGDSDAGAFLVVTALWGLLLHKYTGREYVILDTPLYGPPSGEPAYAARVPLVLRVDPAAPLKAYLAACQETIRQSYSYQNFPLALLHPNGETGRPYATNIALSFAGLHREEPGPGAYGLHVAVRRTGGTLDFTLHADASFGREFLASTEGHFRQVLSYLANLDATLRDLCILTPAERHRVTETFNPTPTPLPAPLTVKERFEQQAAATPHAVAVVAGDRVLTYGQLNAEANRLAHCLRAEYGVQRNEVVALMTGRHERLITGMLGILKAGGAYLPVDPAYPRARKELILADARTRLLLTETDYLFEVENYEGTLFTLDVQLPDLETSAENPVTAGTGEDLAYVIYTSGSTGRPKGVMVSQRSSINMCLQQIGCFGIHPADRVLQMASCAFDASVSEIYKTLYAGAVLVMVTPEVIREPDVLVRFIRREAVTVVTFPPAYLATLRPGQMQGLRVIISAGDAARVDDAVAHSRHCDFYNAYGPTECAVCVTINHVNASLENGTAGEVPAVPVGRPIGNVQVYLLDAYGHPVPVGVAGEICVGGEGLALGYLHQEALTAEKFVPNPLRPGQRMYKTGDRGVWLPDGQLLFAGRQDFQVKIRGYRIEPGEIERTLESLGPVNQAVVLARPQPDGDPHLVAYYTAGEPLEAAALRRQLQEKLPEYMVPAYLIQLDALPLTPNGKVDRKALPDPAGEINRQNRYAAPENPAQERLAATWQQALGCPQVGIDDDFFALGGDSIKAIRLAGEVNKTLGANLEVKDIFNHPNVRSLAALLEKAAPGPAEENSSLEAARSQVQGLRERILGETQWRDRLPAAWEDFYPASDIALGMLYHGLLEPGSGVYHDQMFHQVADSAFDYPALERALERMAARHEILRTSFHLGHFPVPIQVVHRTGTVAPDLGYEDLREHPRQAQQAYLRQYLRRDVQQPFDPAQPGLWRVRVFRLSREEYALLLVFHHAIIDGWSDASFSTELSNLYFRLKTEADYRPAPLRARYKDYILDQVRQKNDPANREFWEREMRGYERTDLPFHKTPDRSGRDLSTATFTFSLPAGTAAAIRQFSAETGIPAKQILLAAFLYLVKATTNRPEVTVGLVSNGRPAVEDGDKMLGCFLNTIPFRCDFPETASLRDFAEAVQAKCVALKAYDRLSLPEILKLSGQPFNTLNPVFDISFNFTEFHIRQDVHPDTDSREPLVAGSGTNHTPFAFSIGKTADHVRVSIVSLAGLYGRPELARLGQYYNHILSYLPRAGQVRLPDVQVMGPEERVHLLQASRGPAVPVPDVPVQALFEAQAARHPEATALVLAGSTLSYGALNARANQLAHYLRDHYGVNPGDRVGVIADRSVELYVALLGILKAGAAYVPVVPGTPPERVRYLLGEAAVKAAVVAVGEPPPATAIPCPCLRPEVDGAAMARCSTANPALRNGPHDPAYVVFTSGTTGRPKGVLVSHKGKVNMALDQARTFGITPRDRVLQFITISFDAALCEIFMTLCTGAALVVLEKETIDDPGQFAAYVQDKAASVLVTTPAYLNLLDLSQLAGLRVVVTGGEAPDPGVVAACARFAAYFNAYGPTECTVTVACYAGNAEALPARVPVGRPIANTHLYVLDEKRKLVPPGVRGEVYVAGPGLATGYLNSPDLTHEKFVDNPFHPRTRLYRTGDLGRWNEEGNLELLSRTDDQLKINGFRVEPGEVQRALCAWPGVDKAVVAVKTQGKGHSLAAFVTASGPVDAREVRNFLGRQLPAYLVPATITRVDRFPLTPNGKTDYAQLLQLEAAGAPPDGHVPPANATEAVLLQHWKRVLALPVVSTADNFFDVGGNSLSLIRLFNELAGPYPQLRMADLFAYPTISALAAYLGEEKEAVALLQEGFDV